MQLFYEQTMFCQYTTGPQIKDWSFCILWIMLNFKFGACACFIILLNFFTWILRFFLNKFLLDGILVFHMCYLPIHGSLVTSLLACAFLVHNFILQIRLEKLSSLAHLTDVLASSLVKSMVFRMSFFSIFYLCPMPFF